MANECVHSRNKSKLPGLIYKLDLEKAYERMYWNFLQYLLRRMGFGENWRGWIKGCVSSACFSILINGSPKGFFTAKRGLRQGDPLSPFLFVIVVKALSRMVTVAADKGLIEGFKVADSSLLISHLLYADFFLKMVTEFVVCR